MIKRVNPTYSPYSVMYVKSFLHHYCETGLAQVGSGLKTHFYPLRHEPLSYHSPSIMLMVNLISSTQF